MPIINRPTRNYKRDLDNPRRKEQASYYNTSSWSRLRIAKLVESPLCERCEALGAITAACEVHHRVKFMNGATKAERDRLFYDWYNLKSVCSPCHKIEDATT